MISIIKIRLLIFHEAKFLNFYFFTISTQFITNLFFLSKYHHTIVRIGRIVSVNMNRLKNLKIFHWTVFRSRKLRGPFTHRPIT